MNGKNSDKSHGSTGMFPHQFGRFLPLVGHLPSENSILSNFSSPRGVAILGCEYHSQAGSATLLSKFKILKTTYLLILMRFKRVFIMGYDKHIGHFYKFGAILPIYIHNSLSLSFNVQYIEQNQAILLNESH